jgi:protoporphyrinogen oxidase
MKHTLLLALLLAACSPSAPPTEGATAASSSQAPDIQVTVMGFESATFEYPKGDPEFVSGLYDAVIVGGGMSGLTACWYLKDKKIVVLERATQVGGLAHRGMTGDGIAYGRGSAYYSEPPENVHVWYKEMGLTPIEETVIPSPIDSYHRNGKLIVDMWEEESFKQLPPEFRAFHKKLLKDDKAGKVAIQPMEQAEDMTLDAISAAEYIKPFGKEVKAYLDSYCQSALGCYTDDVSALAFVNFYTSEITHRYAWPGGTGGASAILGEKLKKYAKTGCMVTKVADDGEGVTVDYVQNGKLYRIRGRQVILAVPLRVTAHIFPGLPEERRKLIASLRYADYVVHQVFTSKDHYTPTYDTWFTDKSFTDLIVARWIETKGFKQPPRSGPGILSIYQPLAPGRETRPLNEATVKSLALKAVSELCDIVPELKKEPVLKVESYRWPASIHIVPPGFFTKVAPKLIPPVGRVSFAANNLGTPSFEEALYRGHEAAMHVLQQLGPLPVKREK